MHTTSQTLLHNLQDNLGDAWYEMDEIYSPMIRSWLNRCGVRATDADDIAQEVIVVMLRKLPSFHRQRTGSFRNWMRHITVNCMREFRRRRHRQVPGLGTEQTHEILAQLEDPDSELTRVWNEEHRRHVLRYAVVRVKDQFAAQTWQAFERTAIRGEDNDSVATDLGMSVNAVYIAKSRVTNQMRQVVKTLLE